MVHSNGIADELGTWFSALLHSTSWKVMPANSGVVTDLTNPSICSSPGSADRSATPSS